MLFDTGEADAKKYFVHDSPIIADARNAIGLKRIQSAIPTLVPNRCYFFISDGEHFNARASFCLVVTGKNNSLPDSISSNISIGRAALSANP